MSICYNLKNWPNFKQIYKTVVNEILPFVLQNGSSLRIKNKTLRSRYY